MGAVLSSSLSNKNRVRKISIANAPPTPPSKGNVQPTSCTQVPDSPCIRPQPSPVRPMPLFLLPLPLGTAVLSSSPRCQSQRLSPSSFSSPSSCSTSLSLTPSPSNMANMEQHQQPSPTLQEIHRQQCLQKPQKKKDRNNGGVRYTCVTNVETLTDSRCYSNP
jgi:hypothetical protein